MGRKIFDYLPVPVRAGSPAESRHRPKLGGNPNALAVRMPFVSRQRLIQALGGLFLITAAAFLTIPFWMRWLLPVALGHFGVSFRVYESLPGQRFALRNVAYQGNGVEFTADRVEVPPPFDWIRGNRGGSNRLSGIQVEGWTLRIPKAPLSPSKASSAAPGIQKATPQPSLAGSLASVQTNLNLVNRWLPRLEMTKGQVILPSIELQLDQLHWQAGLLSLEGKPAPFAHTIVVVAQLPRAMPWSVGAHVPDWNLTLTNHLVLSNSNLQVRGELVWMTNQVVLAADFPETGWIPTQASAVADSIRISPDTLGLSRYRTVEGSVDFHWLENRFRAELHGTAQPDGPDQTAPPVVLRSVVHGDLTLAEIDELTLETPWLSAAVTSGTKFDWQGHMISKAADVHFKGRLGNQGWIAARGQLEGTLHLTSTQGKYPNAEISLAGHELTAYGVDQGQLHSEATLRWPWLEITRTQLRATNTLALDLIASVNLQSRQITNAVLHIELSGTNSLLPGGIGYGQAVLHADAHGSWPALRHQGTVEIKQLQVPRLREVDFQANWAGASTTLDQFHGAAVSGDRAIVFSGSAQVAEVEGLKIEEFSLLQSGAPRLKLEQPFAISFQRDAKDKAEPAHWLLQIQPWHWNGPGGRLSLQADIAWPSRGTLTGELESFDCAEVLAWLESPPPGFQIDRFSGAAHWNRSPWSFECDLRTRLPEKPLLPNAVHLNATGNGEGLILRTITLTAASNAVLSAQGRLPFRIESIPDQPLLHWVPGLPLELHAVTAPNEVFWNELAHLAHVAIVEPTLQLDISGSLTNLDGKVNVAVRRVTPVVTTTNRELPRLEDLTAHIRLTKEALWLSTLQASIESQPVRASGKIPLGKDYSGGWKKLLLWEKATGNLEIAKADVAPFARFAPKVIGPQGTVSAAIDLLPNVQFGGEVKVSDMALRPIGSIGAIDKLRSTVRLAGREVQVTESSGLLGGQPFSLAGKLDLANFHPTTGLPQADFRLQGEGLPLARQPNLILRGDVDLSFLVPTNGRPLVRGTIQLHDSIFLSDLRDLKPGKISQPRQRPPYFSVDMYPLSDWGVDVRANGNRFLKVRTPFFRGEISSGLKIEGTLKEPVALGDVSISSGVVQFPFANLDVSQGLITLSSVDPYRPALYVRAGAHALGYDVRMEVSGSAESPVIEFTSTPPLSSEQILLMLTTGELPKQQNGFSTEQRAGRLALFLGRNLLSEFGAGAGTADRLTIRSGEYISDQGKPSYSLEYKLTDRWSVVGEYDRFGAFNAELKWRLFSR